MAPRSGIAVWISPRIAVLVPLGVAAVVLGGCMKPLFPKDEPRTQYDRYDRVRGKGVPARVTDAHGRPRENVRERLLRKD